jgi:hypothetical protein
MRESDNRSPTPSPEVTAPETSPTETAPPDTLVAPISPTGDVSFDTGVTEVARFVEATRGHPFLEPVKIDLVDDTMFNQLLLSDFDAGIGDIRKTEVALKALGLLPPGADLVSEVRRSLSVGVIGFYDPKTTKLVIRGTQLNAYTRTTLAHELTHALDDQWFKLDRPELDTGGSEAQFGFQALSEGSATWVDKAWTASRPPAEQGEAETEARAYASQVDTSGLSSTVIQIIESPYNIGFDFVTAITTRGGIPALDDAFRTPPVSSEQVMHPAKYTAGDKPIPVGVPPADGVAVDDDTLGELDLTEVLSTSLAPATARTAGEGWGGDHYVVWSTPTGSSCLRVDIVGDTLTDSTEIAASVRQWAAHQAQATVTEPAPGTTRLTACH